MLDVFGNLVLACGVVASGILLVVVNANYVPGEEDEDEDR